MRVIGFFRYSFLELEQFPQGGATQQIVRNKMLGVAAWGQTKMNLHKKNRFDDFAETVEEVSDDVLQSRSDDVDIDADTDANAVTDDHDASKAPVRGIKLRRKKPFEQVAAVSETPAAAVKTPLRKTILKILPDPTFLTTTSTTTPTPSVFVPEFSQEGAMNRTAEDSRCEMSNYN